MSKVTKDVALLRKQTGVGFLACSDALNKIPVILRQQRTFVKKVWQMLKKVGELLLKV